MDVKDILGISREGAPAPKHEKPKPEKLVKPKGMSRWVQGACTKKNARESGRCCEERRGAGRGGGAGAVPAAAPRPGHSCVPSCSSPHHIMPQPSLLHRPQTECSQRHRRRRRRCCRREAFALLSGSHPLAASQLVADVTKKSGLAALKEKRKVSHRGGRANLPLTCLRHGQTS